MKELPEKCSASKFETLTKENMKVKRSVRAHVTNYVVPAQLIKWCLDPNGFDLFSTIERALTYWRLISRSNNQW